MLFVVWYVPPVAKLFSCLSLAPDTPSEVGWPPEAT